MTNKKVSKKELLQKQAEDSISSTESALQKRHEKADFQTREIDSSRAKYTLTGSLQSARLIPIELIKPDPDQPRKTFDPDKLQELADSIKEEGILQPITVEYIPEGERGYFKIITGQRRYEAAQIALLDKIPCVIKDALSAKKRFAQQLIENLQREDFSPIEKAMALLEYKEKLGPEAVWADVERTVGISEIRRKQFISLLNLPENIQKDIVATGRKPAKNQITEKHARALLLLNSFPEKQLELFELIKASPEPITGDAAISRARDIKGTKSIHHFSVAYKNERELLDKLEEKVKELKALLEK